MVLTCRDVIQETQPTTYPQVRNSSCVSEGDLNTETGEISPDRGNHAITVTGGGRTNPAIPRRVRYPVRYLALRDPTWRQDYRLGTLLSYAIVHFKGYRLSGRLRVASGGPVTRMEGPRWYADTQATAGRSLTTPTQAQARPDLGPDSVSVLRPSGQPGC
jgi:hypothetical protein